MARNSCLFMCTRSCRVGILRACSSCLHEGPWQALLDFFHARLIAIKVPNQLLFTYFIGFACWVLCTPLLPVASRATLYDEALVWLRYGVISMCSAREVRRASLPCLYLHQLTHQACKSPGLAPHVPARGEWLAAKYLW